MSALLTLLGTAANAIVAFLVMFVRRGLSIVIIIAMLYLAEYLLSQVFLWIFVETLAGSGITAALTFAWLPPDMLAWARFFLWVVGFDLWWHLVIALPAVSFFTRRLTANVAS